MNAAPNVENIVTPVDNTPVVTTPPVVTPPTPPVTLNLPKSKVVTLTVTKITNEITKGDFKFRILFGMVGSEPFKLPVNTGFYELNEEYFVPGANISVTVERQVGGKTQWLNKKTGETGTHKNSGESIREVCFATAMQIAESNGAAVLKILSGIENAGDKAAMGEFYTRMLLGK